MSKSAIICNRSDYILDVGEWLLDAEGWGHTCGKYINDGRGVRKAHNNAIYDSKLLCSGEIGNEFEWYVNVICTRLIPTGAEVFCSYGDDYWEVVNGVLRRKDVIMVNNFIAI